MDVFMTDTDLYEEMPTELINVKLSELTEPNFVLSSIMAFNDLPLPKGLIESIYQMHWSKPSKIQLQALPLMLTPPYRNLIAQAQTGTGKTSCFAIAFLARVDLSINAPQIISVAPTRELALQTYDRLRMLNGIMKATIGSAVKSMPSKVTMNEQIIVGTPGTLVRLLYRKIISTTHVKILTMDEADVMLEQGGGMIDQALRIKRVMPGGCQVLMFSATFPEPIRKFAKTFAPSPHEITLKKEELPLSGVHQFYVVVDDVKKKHELALQMQDLTTGGSTIIFCNRRADADKLSKTLSDVGYAVMELHGEFSVEERDAVMGAFRRGDCKILITTNLLARGIDILQVTIVINYDFPLKADGSLDHETYLHRIGRAGRREMPGAAFCFVENEKSMQHIRDLEEYFQMKIKKVSTDPYEMEKDLGKFGNAF